MQIQGIDHVGVIVNNLALVQFLTPADEGGIQQLPANTLGIRHIAFAVEDIEAVVASLKQNGTEIFSEIQDPGGTGSATSVVRKGSSSR